MTSLPGVAAPDGSAARHTADARVRPVATVRNALAAYRSQFARVACTAVAVYVPVGFFEAYFVDVGEGYFDGHDTVVGALLLAAVLVVTTVSFASDAFFAGFLDAAVGEEYHGNPHRPLREILRTLPYRRLIVADLLLGALTAVGSLALLVPGLVLFTLFCLVGPLINIEGLEVRAAFARSSRLVRPVFLTAVLVVTLPVVFEHELAHALQVWVYGSYVLKAVVDGLLAAVVYSVVGMVEVTLAYELIRRASVPRDDTGDHDRPGGT